MVAKAKHYLLCFRVWFFGILFSPRLHPKSSSSGGHVSRPFPQLIFISRKRVSKIIAPPPSKTALNHAIATKIITCILAIVAPNSNPNAITKGGGKFISILAENSKFTKNIRL